METFITKISIHECHWKNFIYDLILNKKHCISIMFLILQNKGTMKQHRFDNLDPRQNKDTQLMAT